MNWLDCHTLEQYPPPPLILQPALMTYGPKQSMPVEWKAGWKVRCLAGGRSAILGGSGFPLHFLHSLHFLWCRRTASRPSPCRWPPTLMSPVTSSNIRFCRWFVCSKQSTLLWKWVSLFLSQNFHFSSSIVIDRRRGQRVSRPMQLVCSDLQIVTRGLMLLWIWHIWDCGQQHSQSWLVHLTLWLIMGWTWGLWPLLWLLLEECWAVGPPTTSS